MYDATAAARRLGRMMEAAEAGEFMGIDSLEADDIRPRTRKTADTEHEGGANHQPASSGTSIEDTSSVTRSCNLLDAAGLNPHTRSGGKKGESLAPKPFSTPEDSLERYKLRASQLDLELGHSTTTATVTISHDHGLSIAEQMNGLLDEDRAIEAAQLFMDAFPSSVKQISSDVREVALQAFYMNCKQQNVFIARSIFARLDEINIVSLTMWKMLLFALAKKGCIESVSTLYLKYIDRFHIPPVLLDIVLRCLVESRRITEAKNLLFRNLKHDRDCGLCGVFLAGIWRKTRSIELLNTQLKKMVTILPRLEKRISDKLFNPVLKAYIEFGRLADAEAMANDMKTKYNIPLRCRTKGLLVYGRALNSDWEGVDQGLEEMYERGMTKKATRDFIQVFDRIFLEYWISHSGTEVRRFVFHYVGKFNFQPDRVLYKHIIEAFIEKGDESMIADFNAMARERSWKIPMDQQQFLDTLRSRRLALEGSPVGFWQMFKAARSNHGRPASSQRILGYDQRSVPATDVNKMPFTGSPLPWYERLLSGLTPPRRADNYQKLSKQMEHFMHVGKMSEALDAFETAKRARLRMKQIHLELAMIATLLEKGPEEARAFMVLESQNVQELFTFYPEVFTLVMNCDDVSRGELVKAAVFRFYELCKTTKNLIVKHHITASASHRLILANKPDLALDLLASVYRSQYRRPADFTGVCMKMFIRAFANLGNIQGIRWCILTGMSRGNAVNHEFVVEVRRVLVTLKMPPDAASRAEKEYFERVADMLEKKGQGDPEMLQIRGDPHKKRLSRQNRRPNHRKAMFNQHDIVPTVESWDEEYELEAALGISDSVENYIESR